MERLMEILSEGLDPPIRRQFEWRVRAMDSHLGFIFEREEELSFTSRWSLENVRDVMVLNSFYQIVLAPLVVSTRSPLTNEIGDVPITFGSIRFDDQRARPIRAAMAVYHRIVRELGIPVRALRANHADDVLMALGNEQFEGEEPDAGQ